MANLGKVLKEEIARLSRKQIRSEVNSTKSQVATHRRDIAELKRIVADQRRRLDFLERQEKRRVAEPQINEEAAEEARFSPKWLRSHRQKLGLSAADYAKLVGVSMLSIYNWESEKARPRQGQVAKLAAIRSLGVREARQRLELLNGSGS
jgi:DNA-binding transcriptional regulator YiaG